MSEPFNPYYKWLGIPPEQQPVNYYRLLGVALYEDSEAVIDNAADRQMVFIRTFQSGEHSQESQKLLNELSQARVVLLNKAKKQEYDNKLKREMEQKKSAAGAAAVPVPVPAPPTAIPAAPRAGSRSGAGKSHLFNFSFTMPSPDKNKEKSKKKSGKRGKNANNTPDAASKEANRNKIIIVSAIAGFILLLGLIGWGVASHSSSYLNGDAGFFQTSKIPQPGERRVKNIDGVEYAFRWCPPGRFIMGTEGNEGREKSNNPKIVLISRGFWILENEVTLGMFKSFSSQTGYKSQGDAPNVFKSNNWQPDAQFNWEKTPFPQTDNHPVTCVSWIDAQAFCKWISGKVNQNASLPSESQWEYACRAGSKKSIGGTGKIAEMGRYSSNTNNAGAFPVRSLKPNDWGIYDMHGNVWECCQDVYAGDISKFTTEEAVSGSENATRVRRGGSWSNSESSCQATNRIPIPVKLRAADVGFRFILTDGSVPLASPENSVIADESAAKSKDEIKQASSDAKPDKKEKLGKNPSSPSKTAEKHKPGEELVKIAHNIQFAFRWCPPGKFSMGSRRPSMQMDETLHDVTFTRGFWVLESEVTLGMFKAFVADSGYQSTGEPIRIYKDGRWTLDSQASWATPGYPVDDNMPVSCVSWDDAQAFCQWLGKSINEDVKLPTESQWEYASRAGSLRFFSGSNNLDSLGWYVKNSDFHAHLIKQKKPNGWNLYDTNGNVGEWVQDWAGDYPKENAIDPAGPETGNGRIHRGGSWQQSDTVCRCAFRVKTSPGSRYSDLGFRVCIKPKNP